MNFRVELSETRAGSSVRAAPGSARSERTESPTSGHNPDAGHARGCEAPSSASLPPPPPPFTTKPARTLTFSSESCILRCNRCTPVQLIRAYVWCDDPQPYPSAHHCTARAGVRASRAASAAPRYEARLRVRNLSRSAFAYFVRVARPGVYQIKPTCGVLSAGSSGDVVCTCC